MTGPGNMRAAALVVIPRRKGDKVEKPDNVIELAGAALPATRAHLEPREIDDADWRRFESYVGEIFGAFGLELDTPGTRDTPERFLRALFDATSGYDGDAKLLTAFPTEHQGSAGSVASQIIEDLSPLCASASITRCRSTAQRTSATSPATRSSASPS